MFMQSFKYYKSKVPKPDLTDVIDFDAFPLSSKISEIDLRLNNVDTDFPGLKPKNEWKVFVLPQLQHCIVIRCPFTQNGQRYWMARSLKDYSQNTNVCMYVQGNNLSERLYHPNVLVDWWRELQICDDPNEKRRLKIGMRWATLGYHHNWDTKIYSEKNKTAFPLDLAEMCNYFASVLGFENFLAQAAIVNYYPIGTTLAGHTDHSEPNLNAPLFSFSFGQSAIFLIGGQTKDEKPTALFLKNGDVLVMSHQARICYHAVPRVMKASESDETWNEPFENQKGYDGSVPNPKKLRSDIDFILQLNGENLRSSFDSYLYYKVRDESFWLPFRNYLNDSRININVRQVLQAGDSMLSS